MTTMKMKKKKVSKNTFLTLTVVIFLFSSLLYLASAVFVRSYNNLLSAKQQSISMEVETIALANEEALKDVNELANKNRITAIADSAISYQGQNIVSVTTNE